jgi:Protein of unknown function (DUF1469).
MNDFQSRTAGKNSNIGTLLSGIFADTKNLLAQELTLSKLEFRLELQQVKSAAVTFGIAVAVLTVGAALIAVMIAQLVAVTTELPLWGAYGIVGAVLVVIGAVTMFSRDR